MQFAFRVDASSKIGSGHVIRCLTLAKELTKQGNKCIFICRNHENNLIEKIKKQKFKVVTLFKSNKFKTKPFNKNRKIDYAKWIGASWKADAKQTIIALNKKKIDCLIIDHYGIEKKWEKKLRPFTKNIIVIDDLANRAHECDFLLDQSLCSSKERYQNLVPKYCKQLHGPYYALIDIIYSSARLKLKKRSAKIKRALIYFGSGEETYKLLKTTLIAFSRQDLLKIKLDVVFNGKLNFIKRLKYLINLRGNAKLYTNLPNLSSLMSKADIAIGGAGSTSWERCCMGLPTIGVISADNQKFNANSLNLKGVAILIESTLFNASRISDTVMSLYKNDTYLKMSKKAFSICDGNGSKRVTKYLIRNFR